MSERGEAKARRARPRATGGRPRPSNHAVGAEAVVEADRGTVMHVLRWIVGVVLFLALLFLSLQNSELVTLKFYHWWSWQAPLVFVVLIAFALGVAAGLAGRRAARVAAQARDRAG